MKEQYISYSAFQLAGEEEFIAWILHGSQAIAWEQWLRQHAEVQPAVDQAKTIVLDMARLPAYTMEIQDQQEVWNKIETDILSKSIPAKRTRTHLFSWASVAAAAAIALLVWVITKPQITSVTALAGEHTETHLPDGSQIQLNATSSVTYDKRHFQKDRIVQLEGEAFFRVQPGSRFTVKTARGAVTVLGTSFNVIAWPDRFEVSCYTGKVRVENQHQKQLTITPGQQCRNDEETKDLILDPYPVTEDQPDWLNGKFIFEDQPLKMVIEELERQYNVDVKLQPGLEQVRYSGFFESGDLDEALDLITWPLHFRAEKKGNTISIGR